MLLHAVGTARAAPAFLSHFIGFICHQGMSVLSGKIQRCLASTPVLTQGTHFHCTLSKESPLHPLHNSCTCPAVSFPWLRDQLTTPKLPVVGSKTNGCPPATWGLGPGELVHRDSAAGHKDSAHCPQRQRALIQGGKVPAGLSCLVSLHFTSNAQKKKKAPLMLYSTAYCFAIKPY